MTSGIGSNLSGSWGFSAGQDWRACGALPIPPSPLVSRVVPFLLFAAVQCHMAIYSNLGCPQVCPEKLRITLPRKHLPVPPGPGASWAAGLGGEQGGESVA